MDRLSSDARAVTTDGRNIDTRLGTLTGEASGIEAKQSENAHPIATQEEALAAATGESDGDTYYDLPLLKPPTWIWTIPAYFYVGGLSGATSLLGATAWLIAPRRLKRLSRRARWIGALGDSLSAGLLISDLGRPSRFINMLRVFRPTSPMSVGSWILSVSGASNVVGALFSEFPGAIGRFGRASDLVGGALGLPLAGYTAVLLSNTAVPLWSRGRLALPLVFVSSSMASACALLQLFDLQEDESRVVRRLGAISQATELVAAAAFEIEAGRGDPRVSRVLRRGPTGALWTASRILGVASLALTVIPTRRRDLRTAAGVLGTLGALAMRFAVFHAGKISSRDPRTASRQPDHTDP